MKATDLIPGNEYKSTCFNGDKCKFIGVNQECSDGSALITVEYKGRLYFASCHQLYV